MAEDHPSVEGHYDALADHWKEFTEIAWKKHALWPAVESLLPELDGKRVLDVGCGDGTYSARLADRGADVLGVDLSREMLDVARDEHGDTVAFRRADLRDSLAGLDDDRFDVVLCQHVFSHLPDLETPFSEFARVLDAGRTVVVSTHHPFHDYLVVDREEYPDTRDVDEMGLEPVVDPVPDRPAYLDTERFEIYWGGRDSSNPGSYYRRPLTGLLGPLLDAGFELRELVEPDLRGAVDGDLPRELLHRPPRSLCFRADLR